MNRLDETFNFLYNILLMCITLIHASCTYFKITQPRTNDLSLFYLFFIDFFGFAICFHFLRKKKNKNNKQDRKIKLIKHRSNILILYR